jgi:hypothetical protein
MGLPRFKVKKKKRKDYDYKTKTYKTGIITTYT